MRGSVLIAFFSVILFSFFHLTTATAADLYYPKETFRDRPIKHYPYSWSGLYLGVHGGYAFGESSSVNELSKGGGNAFDDGSIASEVSVDPEGFAGGLQIGYNLQENKFVYGIEVEGGYIVGDDTTLGENFAEVDYGIYGVLTGRLGYASDKYYAYFKGGVAIADIETQAADVVGGVAVTNDLTKSDETYFGYVIGGGLEHAFNHIWTFKIEYLFMDFEEDDSTNIDGDVFTHKHEIHSVKFGMNHKF